jgi:hypothetical protein
MPDTQVEHWLAVAARERAEADALAETDWAGAENHQGQAHAATYTAGAFAAAWVRQRVADVREADWAAPWHHVLHHAQLADHDLGPAETVFHNACANYLALRAYLSEQSVTVESRLRGPIFPSAPSP